MKIYCFKAPPFFSGILRLFFCRKKPKDGR